MTTTMEKAEALLEFFNDVEGDLILIDGELVGRSVIKEVLEAYLNPWMPMETAPKDGSVILVNNKDGVWVAKYNEVYVSGYRPENPWQSMMLNHKHIKNKYASLVPAGWTHLPNPPKE